MRIRLFISALLMAGALTWVTPPAHAQVNAELVANKGYNLIQIDDYALAIFYLNQAINAKPYVARPYFFRALAKMNLDDVRGAEEDCTKAIERSAYYHDYFKLRSYCRLVLNDFEGAVSDADEGLRLQPDEQYMLFYKALALTELKEYDRADTVYNRVIERYPDFDAVYGMQARMYMLRGDTTATLTALDKAIERDKDNQTNYLVRAQINADRKNWEAVAADLDQAIRLEPDRADLYVNRATARYQSDDFLGTMEDLSSALTLDPSNGGALYNRALLRLQVRDLNGALRDFTSIIGRDPGNFHALYNRALINLELHRWQAAINDFTAISRKYPKFYPLYYGIAQCYQAMGQQDRAIRTALYAEDLIRKYVANPRRNPLDRPTIDTSRINTEGHKQTEEETDMDVMDRYNQLVSVNTAEEIDVKYDDKIRGKVQDRTMNVEPEDMFTLTVFDTRTTLRPGSNYVRDIDDINNNRYLAHRLYLSDMTREPVSPARLDTLTSLHRDYTAVIAGGSSRPVDYLARGVVNAQMRDYTSALADLDRAIALNPSFTLAYLARAAARHHMRHDEEMRDMPAAPLNAAIEADLDRAIELNPRLAYAWYNKGVLAQAAGRYDDAVDHYTRALKIDEAMPEAYFNRAIAYIALHRADEAMADLSRAGQLGMIQAYRIIKKLQ